MREVVVTIADRLTRDFDYGSANRLIERTSILGTFIAGFLCGVCFQLRQPISSKYLLSATPFSVVSAFWILFPPSPFNNNSVRHEIWGNGILVDWDQFDEQKIAIVGYEVQR